MAAIASRFQPRARVYGGIDWQCPYCGHLNISTIKRTNWRIECKGTHCRRTLGVGAALYGLNKGRMERDPDDIVIAEEIEEQRENLPATLLLELPFDNSGVPVVTRFTDLVYNDTVTNGDNSIPPAIVPDPS